MTLKKRIFVLMAAVLCSVVLLFFLGFGIDTLTSGLNYAHQIVKMISWDEYRSVDLKLKLQAEDELNLHKLHMKFYKSECSAEQNNPRYAWISALSNDKYVLPALVLGHLLNNLSCIENKVVLISHKVTQLGRSALESVGFQVEVTEGLDCNYMDRVYHRPEANKGITGTHTRLLAFNLTRFDKVIYLDSDYFPTTSLDHLFDQVYPNKLTAAFCSKPGVVDPCFNAGLLGLVPNTETYHKVMEYWKQLSSTSCPDDQRLLWYYYANHDNWIPISYSYNVRRERYFPMKSFHFAGHSREPRPWDWKARPSDVELLAYDRPMNSVMDIISLWWKYLFTVIREYKLNAFWKSVKHLTL
jgi:hypothetical protein